MKPRFLFRLSFMIAMHLVFATSAISESLLGTFESESTPFRVIEVTRRLSRPWGMAFLPADGNTEGATRQILVTERSGSLKLVRDEEVVEVRGVPRVSAVGQGGLLDVVLHPSFDANRLVYFSYAASYENGYGTQIGRGRLEADRIVDFEVLFTMSSPTRERRHFGSRIAFGPDNKLFFSVGDRGERERAQSLADHAGKILRINDDGSIPEDNTYVEHAGALPEIYSIGHRNPQGLVFDHASEILWAHEHGPRGGDEVNIVTGGRNYGWPVITHGREYSGAYLAPSSKPGLEQPVIHWTPSIAPSGLAMLSSNRFPEWKGNLFAGALRGEELRRMVVEDEQIVHQERLLIGRVGRIRDVREGPDGHLWLLTDESPGQLLRIEPIEGSVGAE